MDGTSSTGLRLVKSLTSPAELAHLKALDANHKLFEGVTRSLTVIFTLVIIASNIFLTLSFMQGLRMLIVGHEQVASLAKRELRTARATQELCEQMKNEMEAARRRHEETHLALMTTSNVVQE